MKIFYRLILLFVLLSLFSVHSFAKKKETKAQTPPVLDGIWEIKFGDSIDTVKQIMEQRGFVAKLQKDGVQQLICELSKNKKVTYEDLQVSKVNFRFDANIEKLEEIQIFFNPSQKKLGKDDPVYNLIFKFEKKYNLTRICGVLFEKQSSSGTEIFFAENSMTLRCPMDVYVYELSEKLSVSRNRDESDSSAGFWDIRFGDSEYVVRALLENKKYYQVVNLSLFKENDSFYIIKYKKDHGTEKEKEITYGAIPVDSVSIIFNKKREAVGYKIDFTTKNEYWKTFCNLVEYLKGTHSFELLKENDSVGDVHQVYVSRKLYGMEIEFWYDAFVNSGRYRHRPPHPKSLMIKGKSMIQDELRKKLEELQKEQNEYNKMKNDL